MIKQIEVFRQEVSKPYKLHLCNLANMPNEMYGSAIDECIENELGELWVSNGEYATRVNYCPMCGYKARSQVGQKPKK